MKFQVGAWLQQRLVNPLAIRLSAGIAKKNPQAAFSIAEALQSPEHLLIVPDSRAGGLFLGASHFWAIRHRYPDVGISLLVEKQKEYIAREIPFVDEVIVYEDFLLPLGNKPREVLRRLREHHFDIAFCFSGEENLCPASLCYKSGAHIRIGFQREDFPFFNIRIVPRPEPCYEPERMALIPQTLGIPQVKERVSWSVSKEGARKIRERFLVGRTPGEKFVGIDISTTSHRITLKQFQIIAEQAAALPNTRVLIFFGYAERKFANRLRETLGQKVLLFQTDDLPKIVALLEISCHFITGNTDLFHLAVSMEVPTIGIIAENEIVRWVPQNREDLQILKYETFQSWSTQQIKAELQQRLSIPTPQEEVPA